MATIITVYRRTIDAPRIADAAALRWIKISEALSRRGHTVHVATGPARWPRGGRSGHVTPHLPSIPLNRVDWTTYHWVKTEFHDGFRLAQRFGAGGHDGLIAKLGSVVGPRDMEGVYFYGRNRERLYAIQEEIAARCRWVTVLSEQARQLWYECFGPSDNVLVVPGAVDHVIPLPGLNPFPPAGRPRCLFAGNLYSRHRQSQPEAHETIIGKLNQLGSLLTDCGVDLYVLGPGRARSLDAAAVRYLGSCPYEQSWRYLQHANVGVVVSAGPFMHNNESTKIYHYLRAGLPVVCEGGFPNQHVVTDANLGCVVESGNMPRLAAAIADVAHAEWDRAAAVDYVLRHHTWDERAARYDAVLGTPG